MTLALTQSLTAVGAGMYSSFLANGGTPAYVYTVVPGGAGGTINSSTGLYTAPAVASSSPKTAYDTILVTDSTLATATAQILVGTPLLLFCEIIQREMGLANGRVYIWDQKILEPNDSGLYIAVSIPRCKPFANTNELYNGVQSQSINMLAWVDLDIISRGPEARDRKEEVLMSLNSVYAEQQMEANSFYIGRLSSSFLNISLVDGAAIPYRYKITCQMQYMVNKTKSYPYFDDFEDPTIYTNP